jgi:hypothetical protein
LATKIDKSVEVPCFKMTIFWKLALAKKTQVNFTVGIRISQEQVKRD